MEYDERETILEPGDGLLLYSDGLVEAHDPAQEMFGFPRLQELLGRAAIDSGIIPLLLDELRGFVGPDWVQEDDLTLASVRRLAEVESMSSTNGDGNAWRWLADFRLPSDAGNEIAAMQRVEEAVEPIGLPRRQIDRLKTAVSEATMNAIEHGNKFRSDLEVAIDVRVSDSELSVRITDHGGGQPVPTPETPDLDAKLAGLQSPRGWGLFLISKMVDDVRITSDDVHHIIELIVNLGGDDDGHEAT
jgi:anti-sigma regulatory factor (Ser/Thr protein kinase)